MALHVLEDLEPLFKIFYTFVCNKVRGNYRQTYGKYKGSLSRNLSTGTAPKFFGTTLSFEALEYNSYFFQNSRFTEIVFLFVYPFY